MSRVAIYQRTAGAWGRYLAAGLSAILWVAAGAASASAQTLPAESFRFELFEPLPSQGLNILNVSESVTLRHLAVSAQLLTHYQKNPLTLVDADDSSAVVDAIISAQTTGELSAALGLFNRVSLGIVLPIVFSQSGDDQTTIGRPGVRIAGAGVGDLRVIPKVAIISPGDAGFGLHLVVPMYLPTGKSDGFLSDDGFGIGASLGADYRMASGFVIALNAGYNFRPKRQFLNYFNGGTVRWGLGLKIPTVANLNLIGSIWGSHQINDSVDPLNPDVSSGSAIGTAVEALGGLEYTVADKLVISGGAGAALVHAVGTPDLRVWLSVGYTPSGSDGDGDGVPDDKDKCPQEAEDADGFHDDDGCPDLDNDADGVADVVDDCPTDPEDIDGFKDDDGCPDRDNDTDGLPDGVDDCPDQAEDQDGFEDADGCPDLDNDGDGIPDGQDKCPGDKEDPDGWRDDDGCPDPDNDGDGVLDGVDQCPERPETDNGFQDDDGCPDVNSAFLELTATEIRIKQKVSFMLDKAEIKPQSFALLGEVAKVLRDNPWITRIRVEGHTDSEGHEDFNQRLSQQRAEAVGQYLVDNGVKEGRIEAKGFGESAPVATNRTRSGRAKNRRVEFVIVDVHDKPVQALKDKSK